MARRTCGTVEITLAAMLISGVPDAVRHIRPANERALRAVFKADLRHRALGKRCQRLGVVRIDAFLQRLPREGAIHRSRIQMRIPNRLATSSATLLLPAPTGPSIAMVRTMFSSPSYRVGQMAR